MDKELLRIEALRFWFFTEIGVVKAVDDVSLRMKKGRTLGLAGESGCGKSQLALSIMRLNPFPGRIVSGKLFFDGEDISAKNENEMRDIRGSKISIIFQDPASSLNPVHTVGNQIAESIEAHAKFDKSLTEERVIELLRQVGVDSPEKRRHEYPHEFSGGMRQRVMIAMALACRPKLLIADEPTTNLDVTIQAQVLDLMRKLKKEIGTSILLITHDLGVIAEMCEDVAIMYAGKILEQGNVKTLFKEPKHPYTSMLLGSLYKFGRKSQRLNGIPGKVPSLLDPPTGCRFHPRCPHAMSKCKDVEPELIKIAHPEEYYVACLLISEKKE